MFSSVPLAVLPAEPARSRGLERGGVVRRRHPAPSRLLALSVAVLAIPLLFSSRAGAEAPAPPAVEIVVRAGDTLWDIAVEHSLPGSDPRRTVAEIVELNGLESSAIRPGDRLVLPG